MNRLTHQSICLSQGLLRLRPLREDDFDADLPRSKRLWAKGWGTKVIRVIADHCFGQTDADALFGVSVAEYNRRSQRAFEKNGFMVEHENDNPQRLEGDG